jgi:hypothetical protein
MPAITGPVTYLDKLLFAQRVIKEAQNRLDQKQAVRDLCEALNKLVEALVDREKGTEVKPADKPEP